MAVEDDEDRAAFLDPDDFGTEASYNPQEGDVVTLAGLYDPGSRKSPGDYGGGFITAPASFTCREGDLPPETADGDLLFLKGQYFAVRSFEPDGEGLVVLMLEKAA